MGRPPTPSEILKSRGTFRADRHGDRPEVPVKKPKLPKWLTAEGKAEWNRQVKLLEKAGLIAELDRAALAVYCDTWADYVRCVWLIGEAEAELAQAIKDARVEVEPDDKEGRKEKREAARHAQQLEKRIWRLGVAKGKAAQNVVRLGDRFGFSPVARARVKVSTQAREKGKGGKGRFFGGE